MINSNGKRGQRRPNPIETFKMKNCCNHKMTMIVLLFFMSVGCNSVMTEAGNYAPRITVQPYDMIAIEGESIELNCDAEGSPQPIIEWYHNGQLIKVSTQSRTTMGGSIQFLDIRSPSSASKQTDAGVYYCEARNPLGVARSKNASLQVAYIKKDFRAVPRDKMAAVGETVALDCLPQAWPEPNITWRRNGRLIDLNEARPDGSGKYTVQRIARTAADDQDNQSRHLVDLFGSQLVIKQVDKSDEGNYSCLVETKGSHQLIERESPVAKLSALVKPYFIEAPEHKTVQVGAQIKLRCRLGGDPEPIVSWRKQNGQALSEKTQIEPVDKTLIIDQITTADQANYVCEGENPIGSVQAAATVTVTARPKYISQPEDQEVSLGSSVQLKCAGDGSPQPLQFWYKEGHRQLMFRPASNNKRPQAALLVAPLSYLPTHSDTSPAINKLFTSMANIQDPFVSQEFGNSYFGNRIFVDNSGNLNIINATTSDTGFYACALISPVGSAMVKAKLSVRQPPHDTFHDPAAHLIPPSDSFKYDLLPPPVIKLGTPNQTLVINASAQLVCDVVSQVSYKIQWFYEQQPLQEQPPRITVLESGALAINNLRVSDSGVYTCVVTAATDQNMPLASPYEPLDLSMLTTAPPIQQSTSHSAMLKVGSLKNFSLQFYNLNSFDYPSSPGPATLVDRLGTDSITIAWSLPNDSGSLPIKEYIVEHYDTSKEHIGWEIIYRIKGKETLMIDGLSAEGSHFFVIRAANGHGVGPSSAIAGPFRTNTGEARYQAEIQRRRHPGAAATSNVRQDVNLARDRLMAIATNLLSATPVSSTSIRLQWRTELIGNAEPYSMLGGPEVNNFLEGFSIRYRAIGVGENLEPVNNYNNPISLPLVTSYIDSDRAEEAQQTSMIRNNRDIDYVQEFSELKVVDHNTEHYTINTLRPFTLYQFFVSPYYKDIDGIPSNILASQTLEDRPMIAPPNLTIRPINSTAVRLLWLHLPSTYTNGVIRNYVARVNRSDFTSQQQQQQQTTTEVSKILNLPLGSLSVATLKPDARFDSSPNKFRPEQAHSATEQYILIYDLVNLTYKSFYSVQLAASTSVGHGPWSEPLNFIMDPKILSHQKISGNDFEDVISKSTILTFPESLGPNPITSSTNNTNLYLLITALIIITISLVLSAALLLYRKNNQKVITWKKAISEHFTNKFYMPSSVDPRASNSIQQNIYDHQQHLIYSGSAHLGPQSRAPAHQQQQQTMWANNGCSRTLNNTNNQSQIVHNGAGDYYSVINNMAEYEELDNHQRNNMQQTASSNSDTSCPSSVTRLLPNQNYSRDLIGQRHEMMLQQQIDCIDNTGGKPTFATLINAEAGRLQSIVPLSPYATTNLMNQISMPQQQQHHQLFSNGNHHQMNLVDHSRQHNFVMNSGVTLDDSSKALMNSHAAHSAMSAFRTLQRNPVNFHLQRGQQFAVQQPQQVQPQMFMQTDSGRFIQQQQQQLKTNITPNPLGDYEHIYSDSGMQINQPNPKAANDIISSSTSSGSVSKSKETHDLHVFSHSSRNTQEILNEQQQQQKLNNVVGGEQSITTTDGNWNGDEDEINQADESTALKEKQGSSQSDNQRTRQLSKRKRQQQRNRMHNNNQNQID